MFNIPKEACRKYVKGVPIECRHEATIADRKFNVGDLVPVEAMGLDARDINRLIERRILKHSNEVFVCTRAGKVNGVEYKVGDEVAESDLQDVRSVDAMVMARVIQYANEETLKAHHAKKSAKTSTEKSVPAKKSKTSKSDEGDG